MVTGEDSEISRIILFNFIYILENIGRSRSVVHQILIPPREIAFEFYADVIRKV